MRRIVTEIQSLGINVDQDITGRKGGAGPAEGSAFLINGFPVNAPIAGHYVKRSPFRLKSGKDRHSYLLFKNNESLMPVEVVPEPQFYNKSTGDGVNYRKIALLHGKDCLATTVLQRCVHWKRSKACGFCSTETSVNNGHTIARKTPEQLAEVAKYARDSDGVTHMVLTSGTGDPPGSEIPYLAQCAKAVKESANIPVQVQIAPPDDIDLIDELKDAGVESVGIHVESFDRDTLERIAPAKAEIGIDRFEKSWKKAVELFGPNQVSSFLIAGLGESPESLAWGTEFLADLGVYPFVVPLRPIPGSRLQNAIPPDPESMKRIYDAVAAILQKKGISTHKIKAGCAKCGACSALFSYEKERHRIICHSARSTIERSEAFAIRSDVFVNEQKMFNRSDLDENDRQGIQLVADNSGSIIGTVRVFEVDSRSRHWVGGRLAVKKEFRAGSAGSLLVKEAMKRVKKKGCKRFTAEIQEKNVPFFKKLGWTPLGSLKSHFGHPHQTMQADLNLVPGDL